MKKIIRLFLILLIAALCVSCADTPADTKSSVTPQVYNEVSQAEAEENHTEEKAHIKSNDEKKGETVQKAEQSDEPICTLEVRCDTILKNFDSLHPSKKDFVPKNGIIYEKQSVLFENGESAFDVLLREMRKNGIHMEFVNTPGLDSSYVEGISNIYEFDCGPSSGWMYTVNGSFPGKGSSAYVLDDGDEIAFLYTLDQGKDIGGYIGQ